MGAKELGHGARPAPPPAALVQGYPQRGFDGFLHAGLAAGGDPAPIVQIAVALLPRALNRDVTRCALAVTSDHDEGIGAHGLGVELELDIGFSRQQKELCGAEIHGRHVNRLARGGALAPGKVHCGEALRERLLVGGEEFLGSRLRKTLGVVARFQCQWHGPERDFFQRDSFGVAPRLGHRLIDAAGEHRAVFPGASVVFAGGDVAAATGEVDLRDVGKVFLPAPARQSGKVGGDFPGAVIAHRVRGVVAQRGQRGVSAPKTQGLEHGVNGSFAGLAGDHVARGAAAAVGHFAVGELVAAVGGDLLDPRLTQADLADGRGGLERLAQGLSNALDGGFMEFHVAHGAGTLVFLEDAFSFEVGDGGVVDVRARDEDMLTVGAGRLGERVAPPVKGGVADFAPVHGDDHDRFFPAGEHHALGEERVGNRLREPRTPIMPWPAGTVTSAEKAAQR